MKAWIAVLLLVVACGDATSKGKKVVETDADLPDMTLPDAGNDSGGDMDEPDSRENPCNLVDCFEFATCEVVDDRAVCTCIDGYELTQSACVPINGAPSIQNLPALEQGQRGTADTFTVMATDPDPTDSLTYALASTTCPFEVQVIADTGGVSWQCPNTTTSCEAVVQVKDDEGLTDEGVLSIACVRSLPVITSQPAASAQEGVEWHYTVTCTDPEGGAVTITPGPADTCQGTIVFDTYMWVPGEEKGGNSCLLSVQCSNGETTETQSTLIAVTETNLSPLLTNLPGSRSVHWGDSSSLQATASDADLPPQNLAFSRGNSNCSFPVDVSPQGLVSWTCADQISSCNVAVNVTDGTATDSENLQISCTNTTPSVQNVAISPSNPAAPGTPLTCTYQFVDADGDPDASTIQWRINATTLATGPTFSNYGEGDFVTCRVTPHDTVSTGTPVTSQGVLAPLALKISAGSRHTCVRTPAGGVRCWGSNYDGRVGSNTSTNTDDAVPPTTPAGLTAGVTDLSAGGLVTCAVQSGNAKCWGSGAWGVIGPSVDTDMITPTTVVSGGVTQVAAGEVHVCALQNGAVKCWGANEHGQVGNSVENNIVFGSNPSPTTVTGLSSGVTKIASGQYHSCAIQNGALKCWGANTFGQLGVSTNTGSSTANPAPITVPGLTSGVTDVVAGQSFTCAVQNNTLKCWGRHAGLVLGTTVETGFTDSPVTMTNISGAYTALEAGNEHVCFLQNGAAKCWGDNAFKQLSSAATSTTSTPVTVRTNSTAVSAGYIHTCADQNGVVYCWGRNFGGPVNPFMNTAIDSPEYATPQAVTY